MIHHVSISARDPKHVADVLAELMHGKSTPFPGGIANSFMAISGDTNGTLIEVYPETVTLEPGSGDQPAQAGRTQADPGYAPFHMLLSVPLTQADVQRIGDREGWRTQRFGRGAPGQKPLFDVIELWVENRLMIEVATPDMVSAYLDLFNPAKLEAALAARAAAA
jgi:hypothetical protein